MRPVSEAHWQDALKGFGRVHVCSADPGAHAMAVEIVSVLNGMDRFAGWYTDSWASAQEPQLPTAAALFGAAKAGDAILLGSRTEFVRTHDMLRQARRAECQTIFVFDHWKNYAEHFTPDALPDLVTVPDEFARAGVVAAFGTKMSTRLQVLPHLALEAAVDRIKGFGNITVPGTISVLLDPTEESDTLGYNWRSALVAMAKVAGARPKSRILIKPHPRQEAADVEREVEKWASRNISFELYAGDTEKLIALADEVWGMTTIALNIAQAAGKTIRSFQVGRNERGREASNPHIEPFVVL